MVGGVGVAPTGRITLRVLQTRLALYESTRPAVTIITGSDSFWYEFATMAST